MKAVFKLSLLALALAGCAGFPPAADEAQAMHWFNTLKAGMSVEEVTRLLGPPHDKARFSGFNEDVFGWNYYEHGDKRMFFNAHFDVASGKLKHTSRSVDPSWEASQTGDSVNP